MPSKMPSKSWVPSDISKGTQGTGKRKVVDDELDEQAAPKPKKPRAPRKPRLLPGFTEESHNALDLKALQKCMKQHVKTLAKMVDRDWHDGYEEQGEEAAEWFSNLEAPLNAVYDVAMAGTSSAGYERINKALLIMADSWVDMNAIPARCDIGEGLSDGESCIEIKALNGVTLNDPDAAFHWVWRVVLVSMAGDDDVADELIHRVIKDAHDYGWTLNADFEDMPPEPNEAVKRLKRVFANKNAWNSLETNYKEHKMRRAIDRRFSGPKHLRTRNFSDNEEGCCVM